MKIEKTHQLTIYTSRYVVTLVKTTQKVCNKDEPVYL